jgi:methylated-DNA-[protein]-cysteine S-methyltransferase
MSSHADDIRRALRSAPAPEAAQAAHRFAAQAGSTGAADITYASLTDTPVGPLLAARTNRGLVRLAFAGGDAELEDLARRVSPRIVEAPRQLEPLERELDEYFAGRRTEFDLPVDWQLIGGFMRGVLRATAAIPYGSTSTYSAVAKKAGNERASRAAGNALGANPIAIVIPCHRVLRVGGNLGGYGGGLPNKRYLLALESGQGSL